MRIGCGLKTIDLTWCTTSIVILDLLSFLLINRFLTWIVLNKRLSDETMFVLYGLIVAPSILLDGNSI